MVPGIVCNSPYHLNSIIQDGRLGACGGWTVKNDERNNVVSLMVGQFTTDTNARALSLFPPFSSFSFFCIFFFTVENKIPKRLFCIFRFILPLRNHSDASTPFSFFWHPRGTIGPYPPSKRNQKATLNSKANPSA